MKRICIVLFSIVTAFTAKAQTSKLQGLWNSSWMENIPTNLATDDPYYHIYHNIDFYFEGDSLWVLEFPCERHYVKQYVLENFTFFNDSTFEYNGERFSQIKKYDTAAIESLKKHQLNPACYSGKWNLIRTESGGDGTGVVFIFPFEVNDELILPATPLDEENVITLIIDGETRSFHVALQREHFEVQLILTPTDAWTEDKMMWMRYWDLPPPTKKELEEIKREEGVPLKLLFRRI